MILKIKGKKAENLLEGETLKILIAVFCILGLMFLAARLYGLFIAKTSIEQAREHVNQIVDKLNGLKEGDSTSYLVTSPENWRIFLFSSEKPMPISCGTSKSCICFCPDENIESCDKGVCKGLDSEMRVGNPNIVYEAPLREQKNIIQIKGFILLNFVRKDGKILFLTKLEKEFSDLLEKNVNFDGQDINVLDAVLYSLNGYFDTKSELIDVSLADKYGFIGVGSIGEVSRDQLDRVGFKIEDLDKIDLKSKQLSVILQRQLMLICDEYYLQIPQGLVTNKGLLFKNALDTDKSFFLNVEDETRYSLSLVYKTTYRGKEIEIKYRRASECVK